jgi:hypothetical protein
MPAVNFRTLLLGTESSLGVITGVTTGTSQPIKMEASTTLTIYLASQGATTGGTILIEEADYTDVTQPYTGTWGQIQSIAASAFTGGAQLPVHVTPTAYGFIRVRISSTITGGGTITVAARVASTN